MCVSEDITYVHTNKLVHVAVPTFDHCNDEGMMGVEHGGMNANTMCYVHITNCGRTCTG